VICVLGAASHPSFGEEGNIDNAHSLRAKSACRILFRRPGLGGRADRRYVREAQTSAYVARSGANSVTVIDTAADAVLGTIAAGNGPRGVTVSRDGSRAYVTNTASDSLTVIDTSTNTAVGTIAVGDGPSGLAVTPDGTRLYVMVEGGEVQAIDTTLGTVVGDDPGAGR
jgi:YVTN family beta-propeller protein